MIYGAYTMLSVEGFDISSSIGALLIAAVGVMILNHFGFKGAPIVAALAFLFVINEAESAFFDVFGLYETLRSVEGMDEYLEATVRVIGVGYLCGISSDVCRELGEVGIAKSICFVARLWLVALAAPYLLRVLDNISLLMGK
jgi:hypothetical protein